QVGTGEHLWRAVRVEAGEVALGGCPRDRIDIDSQADVAGRSLEAQGETARPPEKGDNVWGSVHARASCGGRGKLTMRRSTPAQQPPCNTSTGSRACLVEGP